MNRARQSGQTSLLAIGLALVCLAVSGLAVDGTKAFLMRRTLQNAADAASLAGASELDQAAYYSSGGRRLVLEPTSARTTATRYLALRGLNAEASVEADRQGVVVSLRADVPTIFLGVVGIRRVPVAVQARAAPIPGRP